MTKAYGGGSVIESKRYPSAAGRPRGHPARTAIISARIAAGALL